MLPLVLIFDSRPVGPGVETFYESLDGKNIFSLCLVNGNLYSDNFVGIVDGLGCI